MSTESSINLETITDVNQLKALAYDELQKVEVAQQNLRAINGRLAQLQQTEATFVPEAELVPPATPEQPTS